MKTLHDTQKKILKHLYNNPRASYEQMRVALKMSSTSLVDYHIQQLMAQKYLNRLNRWQLSTKAKSLVAVKE